MWILYAILSALSKVGDDLGRKLALRSLAPITVSWGNRFFAIPGLLLFTILLGLKPPSQSAFWLILILTGLLAALAQFLLLKAIQSDDLSRTIPLLNLTPAFLLVTASIISLKIPPIQGTIGVLLIAAGAYRLNTHPTLSLWHPLRSIAKSQSARIMVYVALLWSVTVALDQIGIALTNPATWALSVNTVMLLALTPFFFIQPKQQWDKNQTWLLIGIGLGSSMLLFTQMQAISLASHPSYVIAIKDLGTLLTVWLSRKTLGEASASKRLWPTFLMTTGVILIALS